MPKEHHKSVRIGIYQCHLQGSLISKGKWITGYYGLFRDDILNSKIIPELQDAKRAGRDFKFPVLIVSYYLDKGDPPKPLPKPSGKLTVKSVGGLNRLRRMIGVPVRRKKIPHTEIWQAVVDRDGQAFKVQGHKLIKSTP